MTSNVIDGNFSQLENIDDFTQPENGESAVNVALGLNEEMDKQGWCYITVHYSDEEEKWLITYDLPNGYHYSYLEASFGDLAAASYFIFVCHIGMSKIKNKSIQCLTPCDPFEAERLKKEIKYKVKVDPVEVTKGKKNKPKKRKR